MLFLLDIKKKRLFLLIFFFIHTLHGKECNLALDIGHTPKHSGALSARGIPEYTFNRRVALYTYHMLTKKGINAFFINDKEKEITLQERTRIAKTYKATHFISFHHDSVKDQYLQKWIYQNKTKLFYDGFSGYSLFVSKKNTEYKESVKIATLLSQELQSYGLHPSTHHHKDIEGERKKWVNEQLGIYRYDNLVVLKSSHTPAILIECGIIVNRHDEVEISQLPYLHKIASSITNTFMQECL